MKLESGIVMQTQNHALVGFADDIESFDDIVHDFLNESNDEEEEKGAKLATYVNQWMYHSSDGTFFACEFLYNSGSLSGTTLLNQWLRQVKYCEAIDHLVLGTKSDAGGGNVSLFSAFRSFAKIPNEDYWIDEEFVRVPNPVDPARWIYLWHCTTYHSHAQKSSKCSV
jgi:hypothetical protein